MISAKSEAAGLSTPRTDPTPTALPKHVHVLEARVYMMETTWSSILVRRRMSLKGP
jgi:hypothetical protein